MDIQSTGASDSDMEMHADDQDRRGIDVAGLHLISDAPVFGSAGESSRGRRTHTLRGYEPRNFRRPVSPRKGQGWKDRSIRAVRTWRLLLVRRPATGKL